MEESEELKAIRRAHADALERGVETYQDPKTGYQVFTALYHKRRGYCCESGCRHCPYGFRKKSG